MNVFIPPENTKGSLESSTDSSGGPGCDFGAPIDLRDTLDRIADRLDSGREAEAGSILKRLTDHYITATTSDIDSLFQEETLTRLFAIVGRALNETTLHMLTFLSVFYNNYDMIRQFITAGPENLEAFMGPLKYLENSEVCSSYCDFLKDTIYVDEAFSAALIGRLFTELQESTSTRKAQNVGHVLSVLVIGQNEAMCYNTFTATERYIREKFAPMFRAAASGDGATALPEGYAAEVVEDATAGVGCSPTVRDGDAAVSASPGAERRPDPGVMLSAVQVLIEAIPLCVRAYDALQAFGELEESTVASGRPCVGSDQGGPLYTQSEYPSSDAVAVQGQGPPSDRERNESLETSARQGEGPPKDAGGAPEASTAGAFVDPAGPPGGGEQKGEGSPHLSPHSPRSPRSPLVIRSPKKLSINLDLISRGSGSPGGVLGASTFSGTSGAPAGPEVNQKPDDDQQRAPKFLPLISLRGGLNAHKGLTAGGLAACEGLLVCLREFLALVRDELLPSPELSWLSKSKLLELLLALATEAADSGSNAIFDLFMTSGVIDCVLSLCESNPRKSVAVSYCSQILDVCTTRVREFLVPLCYWERAVARLRLHERDLIDYALFKASSIESLSEFCKYAKHNGLVPQLFRDDFLTLLVQYFRSYALNNDISMTYGSLFPSTRRQSASGGSRSAADGSESSKPLSLGRKPTEFFNSGIRGARGDVSRRGEQRWREALGEDASPGQGARAGPSGAGLGGLNSTVRGEAGSEWDASGAPVDQEIVPGPPCLAKKVEHLGSLVLESPRREGDRGEGGVGGGERAGPGAGLDAGLDEDLAEDPDPAIGLISGSALGATVNPACYSSHGSAPSHTVDRESPPNSDSDSDVVEGTVIDIRAHAGAIARLRAPGIASCMDIPLGEGEREGEAGDTEGTGDAGDASGAGNSPEAEEARRAAWPKEGHTTRPELAAVASVAPKDSCGDFFCAKDSRGLALSVGGNLAAPDLSIRGAPTSSLAHSSPLASGRSCPPSPATEQWNIESPLATYFSTPLRSLPGLDRGTARKVQQFISYFVLSRSLCQDFFAQKPNSSMQDQAPPFVSSLVSSGLTATNVSGDLGIVISPAVLPNLRTYVLGGSGGLRDCAASAGTDGAASAAAAGGANGADGFGAAAGPSDSGNPASAALSLGLSQHPRNPQNPQPPQLTHHSSSPASSWRRLTPRGPSSGHSFSYVDPPQAPSPGRARSPSNPAAMVHAGTTVFEGFGQLDVFNAALRQRQELQGGPSPAGALSRTLVGSASLGLTASVLTDDDAGSKALLPEAVPVGSSAAGASGFSAADRVPGSSGPSGVLGARSGSPGRSNLQPPSPHSPPSSPSPPAIPAPQFVLPPGRKDAPPLRDAREDRRGSEDFQPVIQSLGRSDSGKLSRSLNSRHPLDWDSPSRRRSDASRRRGIQVATPPLNPLGRIERGASPASDDDEKWGESSDGAFSPQQAPAHLAGALPSGWARGLDRDLAAQGRHSITCFWPERDRPDQALGGASSLLREPLSDSN